MLNFYHDLGVIVKHGNTVILRAEWLIKLFKQLITVRCFDDMVRRKHQLHFHALKQQCGSDLEYDLTSPSVCWSRLLCYVSAGLTCSIILLSAAYLACWCHGPQNKAHYKTLNLTVQLGLSGHPLLSRQSLLQHCILILFCLYRAYFTHLIL